MRPGHMFYRGTGSIRAALIGIVIGIILALMI